MKKNNRNLRRKNLRQKIEINRLINQLKNKADEVKSLRDDLLVKIIQFKNLDPKRVTLEKENLSDSRDLGNLNCDSHIWSDHCKCDESSKTDNNTHLNTNHECSVRFECGYCHYKTWDEHTFKEHLVEHQYGVRLYCPSCGFQSRTSVPLGTHKENVH